MRKALISQVLMPAAAAFTPFKSWNYLQDMCASEYEPLQRQRMRRMHQIRELLVHAYRDVDLYRMALDRAGLDPVEVSYPRKFARVPITSKYALRTGFPDRQLARSYRARALRYSNTSGTTGRPLVLIQDVQDISYKYASILRSRKVAGVDPLASQMRITPNECQPCLPSGDSPAKVSPFGRQRGAAVNRAALFVFLERQVLNPLVHRRKMLEPFWVGPEATGPVDFDRYVGQIRDFQPDVLTLYPLYGVLLARHIQRTGVTPPHVGKLVDFSGGVCTPSMSALISEAFGVRTAQSCGGCEFARYGSSCPDDPDHMHLAETYVYVEAVRPDGELCAPGELGNLIVTSLHSRAMPIIRLEPGDVGTLIEEPCSCGRRSRRLLHGGRIQALIRSTDGRWVTAAEIWERLLFIPGVELFQLVQRTKTKFHLRLVLDPVVALDKDGLGDALRELLGKRARVEREVVGGIIPERSGKLQLVKSTSYEDFRVASVRDRSVPVN